MGKSGSRRGAFARCSRLLRTLATGVKNFCLSLEFNISLKVQGGEKSTAHDLASENAAQQQRVSAANSVGKT